MEHLIKLKYKGGFQLDDFEKAWKLHEYFIKLS
jgi:hypothetical protein